MANIRTLKLNLLADVSEFNKGLETAESKFKKMGDKLDDVSKKAAIGLAALAVVAVDFAKAAAEDENAAKQLEGQLKASTNATDAQVKAIEDYITKTSMAAGVADDQLRPALARLVRSTKDTAEAQDLLNLALDISARTGKDVETVSTALAKANDGNVNALKKLGITLGDNATNLIEYNKEQEKLVKYNNEAQQALAEFGAGSEEYTKAMGKVAEAQATSNAIAAEGIDVFGELGKEFAGAAADKAGTAEGSFIRLGIALNETKEAIGVGLLPVIISMTNALTPLAAKIQENGDFFSKLIIVLGIALGSIVALNYAIKAVTVLTTAWSGVVAVATAAQYLWNIALNANPIGLVIIAVGLLAAGIVLAYQKIEPFRDLIDSIIQKIKDMGKAIKESAFGKAIGSIVDKVTEGKAVGGSVSAGQAVRVGELGSEIFVPTSGGQIIPNNKLGGTGNTFIFNGVIDGESARRSIEQLLQNSARRTGAVNFVGATL
jgi:hypothetical protein